MMHKEKIVSLSAVIIIAGCASSPSIQYNYAAKFKHTSVPNIQQEATVFVGDAILSDKTYYEVEALHLNTPAAYGLYHFPSGYYSKIGSDKDSDFYSPLSMDEHGSSINLEGNARQYVQAIAVKKTGVGQICPIHLISGMSCINADIKIEKTQSKDRDSFEQTLIYNGRVGNTVNIGYREFSNELARAAFTNNVGYDLSQSKQASYKGAEIEILSADNSKITYKVISSFSN
ncbi:hypothetical protein MGA5115_02227 [Marinomonas gallaica]|uniref:Lipoprotein n=1 Tax=Marinomonas gallaica TaxID=1806667 RepID=A0A1C3JSK3_9GAMM|nr:hypothetical protein [Marinomonas gallaica]SBT18107.1 hypothetical protein MGA5115_02227 [Marinomonas gallaica]SBT22487.1 hypothetical protein MGA5116_03109 [Marinomonas gallaica]